MRVLYFLSMLFIVSIPSISTQENEETYVQAQRYVIKESMKGKSENDDELLLEEEVVVKEDEEVNDDEVVEVKEEQEETSSSSLTRSPRLLSCLRINFCSA